MHYIFNQLDCGSGVCITWFGSGVAGFRGEVTVHVG